MPTAAAWLKIATIAFLACRRASGVQHVRTMRIPDPPAGISPHRLPSSDHFPGITVQVSRDMRYCSLK
ncbi:hypothetical protein C8J36_103467 [Rhizobium sp. PP-F2F-G48]|uniref:hypothetical protein n=1 Tax=Rhizobium sp. PP-F2F-G48 TaxID=2135651 RepID=UPI001051A1D1|nr:hypothetical protein [Rhizobium sp. PP-F2F-G48]TCM56097.1 hypothetical protein C8J36_103467 [Rhizobium sp. PP-F2F-G48]